MTPSNHDYLLLALFIRNDLGVDTSNTAAEDAIVSFRAQTPEKQREVIETCLQQANFYKTLRYGQASVLQFLHDALPEAETSLKESLQKCLERLEPLESGGLLYTIRQRQLITYEQLDTIKNGFFPVSRDNIIKKARSSLRVKFTPDTITIYGEPYDMRPYKEANRKILDQFGIPPEQRPPYDELATEDANILASRDATMASLMRSIRGYKR